MAKQFLTVLIGRFSPLHLGQCELIDHAVRRSEHVLILIGSAKSPRTPKNPWRYTERWEMLSAYLTQTYGESYHKFIHISPLGDVPYRDQLWAAGVQRIVDQTLVNIILGEREKVLYDRDAPGPLSDLRVLQREVYLAGFKKDWSSYYLDLFPNYKKSFVRGEFKGGLSATDVRNMYFSGSATDMSTLRSCVPGCTYDYLRDWRDVKDYEYVLGEHEWYLDYKKPYATNPYKPYFVTTDAVVVTCGHVLLGKRRHRPGLGLWCLPGGFLNQEETLFDGAIRELIEETKIKVPAKVLVGSYTGEMRPFDAPGRSLRGRVITNAYLFHLADLDELPKLKGSDDMIGAQWVPISQVDDLEEDTFEDHHAIVNIMIAKLPEASRFSRLDHGQIQGQNR